MIALVDGNNFFVSCERVFQPQLRQAKVVVLSNNDGCIISRSNEAKAIGIQMGQPLFEIKKLIEKEQVKVFSSNFVLYGNMSERIMTILEELSPQVEVYSIDEAFCDLDFIIHDQKKLTEYGWHIKNTIQKNTGIPCGIGISYTKVLAKIANRIAKKSQKARGVLALVEDTHIDFALSLTPVEDIWGIGRQYAKLLRKHGIFTAKDFRDTDEQWVLKHLTIVGSRIQKELRKQNMLSLESFSVPKKSILVSRSFSKYLCHYEEIFPAFSYYVSSACRKMRRQKSETNMIGVSLRTNPFAKQKKQHRSFQVITLPFYTSCDFHILTALEKVLKSMVQEGLEYKKGGVMMLNLSPQSDRPSNLFDQRNISKERDLWAQIDAIQEKFGYHALFSASMTDISWKPKSLLKSPNYTGNIKEILNISN